MRTWLILRHAQALADSVSGRDVDRLLSEQGERDAIAAGEWLWQHNLTIDRVLCSPAARTQRTAELAGQYARAPGAQVREAIYEGTPGALIRVLDEAGAGTTLLIGHNPGVEQLVAFLTEGRSDEFRGMPTAGLAWLEIPADVEAEPGSAKLRAFWSP